MILLDCCAGAASATFPNGKSITETISASSWDAIAPDPGRYSFTNALIEVLGEWRQRVFSAAMLHAEVLARLKHPRPITINGKHFEARSTPVHFMMTANHRAPSIELGRIVPNDRRPPSPPQDSAEPEDPPVLGRGPIDGAVSGPNEDEPHVMISLALEDDQRLDLGAWEQWLASFPALAKYVKVQGVFKSHSTLLLLSIPVMVWDLLPEDHACSFVAFIRSNNLIRESPLAESPLAVTGMQRLGDGEESEEDDDNDRNSVFSGTTYAPTERRASSIMHRNSTASGVSHQSQRPSGMSTRSSVAYPRVPADVQLQLPLGSSRVSSTSQSTSQSSAQSVSQLTPQSTAQSAPQPTSQRSLDSLPPLQKQYPIPTSPSVSSLSHPSEARQAEKISRTAILNQQRSAARKVGFHEDNIPHGRDLAQHIVDRLEQYFQTEPNPSVAVTEFFASNLGVETRDIDLWFYRRRQQQLMTLNLRNLKMDDHPPEVREGVKMILPGHLNTLLEMSTPSQVLLLDLRSPTDFEKSHVYGAVNLRVPDSLVRSHFELLDRAFTDDHSRRNFAKWNAAKCVVVYDRVVEFTWECPTAETLCDKFKGRGWEGQVYILKGHYHEFSKSFDKYITGNRMSQAAKDYIDGLRAKSPMSEVSLARKKSLGTVCRVADCAALTRRQAEMSQSQEKYDEWMKLVEYEDRVPSTGLIPSKKAERMRDVEQHQAELEGELEARNPVLYNKTRDLWAPRPQPPERLWESGSRPRKDMAEPLPDLVAPLSRGLDKMHEAAYSDPGPGYGPNPLGYDKLGEPLPDEFDEIDPRDELLRNDPAFQKAGDQGADLRKASSRERPFWRRLRSANK